MGWNYRILFDRRNNRYSVHEVYPSKHGEIRSWTSDPVYGTIFIHPSEIVDSIKEDIRFNETYKAKRYAAIDLHRLLVDCEMFPIYHVR